MADFASILDGALQAITQSSAGMLKAADFVTGTQEAVQSTASLNARDILQAGNQTAEAAKGIAEANYAQRKTLEHAQAVLGLNPDDVDNELARSTQQLTSARQQQLTAAERVKQLSTVGLLDDPLGFIMAQLELPQAQAQLEATTFQHKAAETDINARLDIANKIKSTVIANTADRIQAAELMQANAALSLSQVRAREATIQAAGQIAGMEMQKASLLDRVSDNKVKVVSMQLQAAQAQAQREQTRLARDQWDQLKQERLDVMLEKKEARAQLEAPVKRFGDFIGIPDLTVAKLDQLGPKGKVLLQAAISNQLGSDLYSSADLLDKLPVGVKLPPGPHLLMSQLAPQARAAADAAEVAAAKADTKIPAKQKPEIGWGDLQSSLQNQAMGTTPNSGTLADSVLDSKFSPYRMNHKVMLDEIAGGVRPELAGNLMAEAMKTVASTSKAGTADNLLIADEQRALHSVIAAAADRKLPIPEIASQIKTYYQAGVVRNMELLQYPVLGLAPQTAYKFKLSGDSIGGADAVTVDLLNTASIEAGIKKQLSQRGLEGALRRISTSVSVAPLVYPSVQAGKAGYNLFKD